RRLRRTSAQVSLAAAVAAVLAAVAVPAARQDSARAPVSTRNAGETTTAHSWTPTLADPIPLADYLTRLKRSLTDPARAGQDTRLEARVTAESRSGVRRLRVRNFQVLSDSDRNLAGYSLGAGSWDTEVGVLASAVAQEFVVQAALADVPLDSVDVVFTSRQDAEPRPAGKVAYPRNLQYEARLSSPASDEVLEQLRQRVQRESPVLSLVAEAQSIDHGRVVYTQSPAQPAAGSPPGLRDFLVEKRAALQKRAAARDGGGASAPLQAHARVEGGTGLRHVRIGETGYQVFHDAPREAGGFDLGPTTEEHQLGVMGTCLTHIFEIQAAQRQVVLDHLEVRVEGTLTPRRADRPSRLEGVRYSVHISSPAPASEIDALRQAVEAVCPIYNLLKDPQPITGRIVRVDPPPARPTTATAANAR
ncbi:MAG TPA: OsmC family protein, partial [Luteitalea sp.]|nr:OsmC family protein [Luteitalea sp.]